MLPTISVTKPIIITPLSIPSHFNMLSKTKTIYSIKPFTHFINTTQHSFLICKSSNKEQQTTHTKEETEEKMPEKKKPLYAHSLPCIEKWLRELGFCQTADDPAAWVIEKSDWHAKLNLDVTDLYIRYLKTGPGNLEKDVERRFSYALSREDIENAILGGP